MRERVREREREREREIMNLILQIYIAECVLNTKNLSSRYCTMLHVNCGVHRADYSIKKGKKKQENKIEK